VSEREREKERVSVRERERERERDALKLFHSAASLAKERDETNQYWYTRRNMH
jgi:hypothetical protein